MIHQTYYPFDGEGNGLPSSSPAFSGFSTSIGQPIYKKEPDSTWLMWIILIATFIGAAGLIYWWRQKYI